MSMPIAGVMLMMLLSRIAPQICFASCISFALLVFPMSAKGGVPTSLDLDLWAIGSATSMVIGEDNGVYVAGGFVLAERQPASGIIRIDQSGQLDSAFDPAFDGAVNVVHPAPGGGVFVGGQFETVNGQPVQRLVLLDAAGNVVNGWNPSSDGGVFSMYTDGAGALYISGLFSSISGNQRSGIARLSVATGILDELFSPSVEGTVVDIAVDGLGRVWVGGLFSAVNGVPTQNLVVLDELGQVLETFETDGPVRNIAVGGSGAIYVCGDFSQVGGEARSAVARFTASVSPSLDAWQPSVNDDVFVCIADEQSLLIGGDFSEVEGLARGGVARINGDGSIDSDFGPLASGFYVSKPGGNARILSMALAPDGGLFLGGLFGRIDDQVASSLALVDRLTGEVSRTYELERPAEVRSGVARLDDGSWVIGGQFRRVGDSLKANLVRILDNGSIDEQWPLFADGPVRSMEKLNDGSLVIGGLFGSVSGERRLSLARISDPAQGILDDFWQSDLIGTVGVIKQDSCDDDLMYVGGFFGIGDEAGIEDFVNFAKYRLSENGQTEVFDISFDGQVNAIDQLDCDEIYVGGSFDSAGGVIQKGIARIITTGTGLVDLAFSPGLNGAVWSLMALPEVETLILGGEFTQVFGQSRQRLAKLTPQLSSWNPGANGVPVGLALDGLGGLYAVGTFTRLGGQDRLRIAKTSIAEPSILDPDFNPGADGPILWGAQIFGNELVVSGNFTQIGGLQRRAIASFVVDVAKPDFVFSDRFEQPVLQNAARSISLQLDCDQEVHGWYDGPLGSDILNGESPPCGD